MTEQSKKARQGGYTLIEMAIVISVLGVILASFIGAYGLYHKSQVQMTSLSNANRVVNALGHYLVQNGRYPCPARMDVPRDHPNYGMETDCTDTTLAPGNCANGICIELGERQVNINPNPGAATNITPRVRRGAVPFRILGLPEMAAEDGYKSRMYYAVTENLTSTATYRKDAGGISVLNENDVTLVSPASSAHFVVFSVGADRRGAVTRYGQEYLPCADPAAAADALNCHTSTTAPHNFARYRMSAHSTSTGAAHYDDYMRYYASVETPLWRVTGSTSTDIVDLIDVGAGGRIGVGVNSPAADVHVVGDVRTSENVLARQICNTLGGDCFMVDAIGGDDANPPTAALQCNNPGHPSYDPARPFVIGYALGQAVCGTGTEDVRCPTGQILRGVAANGDLMCESVTGCAPITVNMCQIGGVWEQAFIPSGITGQVHQTAIFGASFRRTYLCQGGNWTQQSTSGSCNCTEVVNQLVNVACNTLVPGSPAAGWTGTATRTFSRSCPSGVETYGPIDYSGCACASLAGLQENRTCQQSPFNYPSGFACPAGQSPKRVRDWNCTGPQTGVYTGFTALAGSDCCTCAAGVRSTQNVPCGTGFTGTKEQERFTACPGFTPWTDTGVNSCACNTSLIDTGTQACPDGQVGVIQRRRDWNCAASPPAWGDWYTTSDNCGPVTYQWVPKVTGEGPYGVALPNTAGTTCPTPAQQAACSYPATGGYTHYSACRCE
ncbi:MAG: type II secretion system protein [Alphaproteobacteria bacterium]